MPTKLPVISLVVTEDIKNAIDKYQKDNGILSRNEAVRQLLMKALKEVKDKKKPSQPA